MFKAYLCYMVFYVLIDGSLLFLPKMCATVIIVCPHVTENKLYDNDMKQICDNCEFITVSSHTYAQYFSIK